MPITTELPRLAAAGAAITTYAALCAAVWLRERRRQRRQRAAAAVLAPGADHEAPLLIAYASQSGHAEQRAEEAAHALRSAGVAVRCTPLNALGLADLSQAARALFVVSTSGEGDAPDNAALFARRLMTAPAALPALHYGVLALGDRSYAQFCGFGRVLDDWLRAAGARALFARIEVDRVDAAALDQWQHALGHIAGSADLPAHAAPAFADWRLAARRCLNPGSAGAPIWHLELEPADGQALPHWEAGDLVQILAPGDPQRAREYSISSLPADGRLHLLVREQFGPQGAPGVASGWLARGATLGGPIRLALRPHRNFRLGDNAGRPLILIGNGTGLAGLRAHLRQRAATGDGRNWLIFGERNAAHDFHYRDEIEAWQRADLLVRTDLAFSRDQHERLYVQHRLAAAADTLRDWLAGGAAIYVCGNAVGMAAGVDATLAEIIGEDARDALIAEGRYRRDVY